MEHTMKNVPPPDEGERRRRISQAMIADESWAKWPIVGLRAKEV
jgi:hypothetical protein